MSKDDAYVARRMLDIDRLSKEDFIHPTDATKHGYWGVSPESDRDQYTVTGVAKLAEEGKSQPTGLYQGPSDKPTQATAQTQTRPDSAPKGGANK